MSGPIDARASDIVFTALRPSSPHLTDLDKLLKKGATC